MLHLGAFDRAVDLLQEIEVSPQEDPVHGHIMGSVLYGLGDQREALRIWREIGVPGAHFLGRARTELDAGLYADAVASAELAAALSPDLPDVYLVAGRAEQQRGELEAARHAYRQYLQRVPESRLGNFWMGEVLFQLAQVDAALIPEAAATLQTAFNIDPSNMGAAFLLSQLLTRRGDWEAAEVVWQTAREARPNYFMPVMYLGKVYLDQGNVNEAIALLQEAIDLDSDQGPAHLWIGLAYRKQDLFEESLAHLDRAHDLAPRQVVFTSELARGYELLDNLPMAVELYKQALVLEPSNQTIQNRIDSLEAQISNETN